MRIRLDENIPIRLISALEEMSHIVDSVANGPLQGCADDKVWHSAREDGVFFVTQDLDFSDIRQFAPGTHPGILLVRLMEPGRQGLFRRILYLFEHEDVESWKGCFIVATDRKIRIRRPEN